MNRAGRITAYLTLILIAGCKTKMPQVAGKWHGTGALAASVRTAISSKPRTENVPVDVVFVLTQTDKDVRGDAAITAATNKPIHIPIQTGVVQPDGTLSLEGDATFGMARAHLSFGGKSDPGKITGTVDVALDNVGGTADNKGPITLTPSN